MLQYRITRILADTITLYQERNLAMKKFSKILSVITGAAAALSLTVTAWADYGSVTVMGDSIATGYGLDGYVSGDNYSAASSFGSIISDECSSYINLAVDGRTTTGLIDALESDLADAVTGSDQIIISIGGNDYLQPMQAALYAKMMEDPDLLSKIMSGEIDRSEIMNYAQGFISDALAAAANIDASAVAANIQKITDDIAELNSGAEIYLFTIYDPFEGVEGMEDACAVAEAKLGELNSAISDMEGGNIHVVDVYGAFRGHAIEYTNISMGDIHLNAAGHAVIADLLASELSDIAQLDDTSDNAGADVTPAPEKTSPDTGLEGIAAVMGTAALAGAAMVLLKRKSR